MRPTVIVCVLFAGMCLNHALDAAEPRPNFLFIYTDDQRWDALGVVQREQGDQARFPWFTTPNLDRLASGGVRFRNAFVVMALCAPSRAAFLTGQYNHLNGIANNHTPFPTNSVTWATELRRAGYTTAYIGKWHMGSQRGHRPGFDYSASFIGHARYHDAPFEINGVETRTTGWVDDASTDFAIQFLAKNKDRPWAMAVGFKTPHGPFEPPARWAKKWADGWLRPTPSLTNLPPFPGMGNPQPPPAAAGGPPGAWQANLDYFRCLGAVDENVGKILQALDEQKLTERTMVIYASDNGFYLREHGLSDKRSAYDESMRIPLLLRYPPLTNSGTTRDDMVLNVDLAPTLLDFAGVTVPRQMQGRSWRPLLIESKPGWRTSFFYEYFWEPQKGNTTPSLTAVRSMTAKLIRYKDHPEWTELFDLASDPHEVRNLYTNPAHAAMRQAMEAEYDRQVLGVGYVWPAYADDPGKFKPKGALNAWVLDFNFANDKGDQVRDSSGRNNHGKALSALLVSDPDGKPARQFSGKSSIDVQKSPTLNPAVEDWTVEVTFKPQGPDGVLLAHGGASYGYCVALQDGKPLLAVVGGKALTTMRANTTISGDWVTLQARLSSREAVIEIDGMEAARNTLKAPLDRYPAERLQIGADLGSQVLPNPVPGFRGLIRSVRIYSGVAPVSK